MPHTPEPGDLASWKRRQQNAAFEPPWQGPIWRKSPQLTAEIRKRCARVVLDDCVTSDHLLAERGREPVTTSRCAHVNSSEKKETQLNIIQKNADWLGKVKPEPDDNLIN